MTSFDKLSGSALETNFEKAIKYMKDYINDKKNNMTAELMQPFYGALKAVKSPNDPPTDWNPFVKRAKVKAWQERLSYSPEDNMRHYIKLAMEKGYKLI